ncbi:MAG TPA: radical SAM protein [Planctomycetota bacterium]|nr:radical SAM protein [Planctomycetota bacterium]
MEPERPPRLIGIARLAAESAPLDARNGVDYRTLDCRSCLNRQANPRLPFRFTINPYRGCEFGCAYCYARYTHEYLEHRDWLDFERKIYVKERAPEHLERELASERVRREPIALGTATDPYQPAERRRGLTRRILEVIARHRGLDFSITTKSDLVLRDLDLLRRIAARSPLLHVNVTITTADRELARRLEPRAPTPEKRLAAVRALREAGIVAGVFCAPVLPLVTDDEASLDRLFAAAREAGALYVMTNLLFLMPSAKRRYMPFIEAEFPGLARRFAALYGPTGHAPPAYRRAYEERVRRVRERHGGIGSWWSLDPACAARPREEQRAFEWPSVRLEPS